VTRRRGGGEARRQDLGQAEAEEAQPNLLGPARESTTFLHYGLFGPVLLPTAGFFLVFLSKIYVSSQILQNYTTTATYGVWAKTPILQAFVFKKS
jgi:hypothetical protein